MRECVVCGMEFRLPDPLDNAYDIRVHLKVNPSHMVINPNQRVYIPTPGRVGR